MSTLAIIGAGNVGGTLGRAWAARGHTVVFGVRSPADAKVKALVKHGDDAAAKDTVVGLARELGFDPVDAGPPRQARLLEPLAMLWISMALAHGHGPNIAFRLLRK